MTNELKIITEWLINIGRELGGTLTIEEALHVILENITKFCPHQTLAVLAVNENTNNLSIKNSRNLSYGFVKNFSHAAHGNVIDRVLMKHECIFFNDLDRTNPDYAELKLENDFKHVCLVPIIQHQRAVGYLHCDRVEGPLFDEDEARKLLVIGYMVGQQIAKHELLFLTRHLARIDEASKALKYHAFLEQYHREVARTRTYGTPLTLMLFSVDNYTQHVTTCGIAAGHALLEEIHHLIHGCAREIDIVGRFAANEFIVCLGGMNSAEARATLEHIHGTIQKQTALATGCPIIISSAAMTFERKEDLRLSLEQIFAKLGGGLILGRKRGHNQLTIVSPGGEHH